MQFITGRIEIISVSTFVPSWSTLYMSFNYSIQVEVIWLCMTWENVVVEWAKEEMAVAWGNVQVLSSYLADLQKPWKTSINILNRYPLRNLNRELPGYISRTTALCNLPDCNYLSPNVRGSTPKYLIHVRYWEYLSVNANFNVHTRSRQRPAR
jgi:hypothetical protein